MKRIALSTTLLFFLSHWSAPTAGAPPEDIDGKVGRYQLMSGAGGELDLRIYLIDTATGQCWSKSDDGSWVDEGNPVSGKTPSRAASMCLSLPDDKIEVKINQRGSKSVPIVKGEIRLALDDISRGQVMLSVRNGEGDELLERKSVKQGDVHSFKFDGQDVYVRVAELQNYLIGEDYGVFELSGSDPRVETERKKDATE
jgi:hypothetical protein